MLLLAESVGKSALISTPTSPVLESLEEEEEEESDRGKVERDEGKENKDLYHDRICERVATDYGGGAMKDHVVDDFFLLYTHIILHGNFTMHLR